jgi:hypothetical protein
VLGDCSPAAEARETVAETLVGLADRQVEGTTIGDRRRENSPALYFEPPDACSSAGVIALGLRRGIAAPRIRGLPDASFSALSETDRPRRCPVSTTSNAITEPLRAEHRALMTHVEHMRVAARELPDLAPEERDLILGRVTAFLEGTLVPHARHEEDVLYRVIGDILGQPRATEPMIHDHEMIRETAQMLEHADRDDVALTQELLYRLYGLVVAHFRKEEDLYLPILDAHPDRAEQVLAGLRDVEH